MHDLAMRILTATGTNIFFAGQAGFIIKSSSGQMLAVDLYLSDCVERLEGNVGFKRLLPKMLSPYELKFDAVICTHPHWDHFDVDAVPAVSYTHLDVYKRQVLNKVDMQKSGYGKYYGKYYGNYGETGGAKK